MKKLTALLLIIFFCCICRANENGEIDDNGFFDSTHHWYDIYEETNIINPEPNQGRYKQAQIKEIADNILLYQKDNGGWPKNYDMRAILTAEQKEKLIKAKNLTDTTFDNQTTYTQIAYLSKAYQILKDNRYKDAALRGIDFTLSAQYANGGWPQYFPLRDNYSRRITFNDDAMTGVMRMMQDIINKKPEYSFLDNQRRQKAKIAFDKGLDCILKCQIVDNGPPRLAGHPLPGREASESGEAGKLTAWCQQHDEKNLKPAKGRAYELPSICNDEGAGVVLLLMSIDKPNEKIIKSIEAAVKWFEESKIYGIRVEEINAPEVKYPLRISKIDRIVVKDPNAPPIWTRFYELGTHRPLFADRRSIRLYSLAEVDRERRSGYRYYTYEPQKVLNKYPEWKNKI